MHAPRTRGAVGLCSEGFRRDSSTRMGYSEGCTAAFPPPAAPAAAWRSCASREPCSAGKRRKKSAPVMERLAESPCTHCKARLYGGSALLLPLPFGHLMCPQKELLSSRSLLPPQMQQHGRPQRIPAEGVHREQLLGGNERAPAAGPNPKQPPPRTFLNPTVRTTRAVKVMEALLRISHCGAASAPSAASTPAPRATTPSREPYL